MKKSGAIFVGAALCLTSCMSGLNYKRPIISAPSTFRGQAAAENATFADQAWWSIYSDPLMDSLIKEALKNNYDLRIAISRVEEARAYVGVARADLLPEIDFDSGVQRDRGVYKANPDLDLPANGTRTKNLFLGGLSSAWEIDLWGRVRRQTEAATATYLGSEEARRGVVLSLVSDVATAYLQLVELDRRLGVAKSSRDAFKATRKLFSERFGAGIVSKLQVTRAEAALAGAEGTIADIEQQIAAKENQICVLAGRDPGPVLRSTPEAAMTPPPAIPAGLPSELLERRPDLLQAEQNLRNASANIGVANANFFPRIGLTAVFGRVSTQLSTLTAGGSNIVALASSLSGPLFTGGRLTNEYRAAKDIFDQAKLQYAQGALRAFEEVSDTLIASQKLTTVEEQQTNEVAALEESVTIARKRYLGGLASYYEVLEAQQLLYPAELSLSQTSRDRRLAIVQLYKALGGGWKLSDAQWKNGQ